MQSNSQWAHNEIHDTLTKIAEGIERVLAKREHVSTPQDLIGFVENMVSIQMVTVAAFKMLLDKDNLESVAEGASVVDALLEVV